MIKVIEDYKNEVEARKKNATEEQRKAANPHTSVWVEASAGTGKTKVLSDRVLQLLLHNVRPEQILCLTYTKAAAAEMNTRISKRLSEWAVIPEEKLEESLLNILGSEADSSDKLHQFRNKARTLFACLLDTPGGLKIQTIHSFCQNILKRFPLEAGISPYFEIMNDRESSDILESIQTNLLSKHNSAPVGDAIRYLTREMKEEPFENMIEDVTKNRYKIAEILVKHNGIDNFLQDLQKKLSVNPIYTAEDLKADFMQKVSAHKLAQYMEVLSGGSTNDQKKMKAMEEVLSHGLRGETYEEYRNLFLTKEGERRADSSLITKKNAEKNPQTLENLIKDAEDVLELERTLINLNLYNSTKAFFTIAQELNNRFEEYKQKSAKLDYSDLIRLTVDLLSDSATSSWVLFKLDGGINHILVDEAQDTSPEQWQIVKSLSEEFFAGDGQKEQNRTIFVVGDRKQSIYSFQGADPHKFDEMASYFATKAKDKFARVNLHNSFRSAPAVLETVNHLFAQNNVADGVVSADEKVNHVPVRAGQFGRVEIWPMMVAQKDDKVVNDKEWLPPMEMTQRISVRTKLAQKMATTIRTMVDKSAHTAHPLRYRDFMILVRKRNDFVTDFIRACKKENVNIAGADVIVLSKQIVVQDLLSLGKFLLLPQDDLSLAEVLKSPLFGLTDAELEDLCFGRGNKLLWTCLQETKKYENNVTKQLKDLFDDLDYIRPYELYTRVLREQDGRKKFIARMGVEVEDALDEFMNQALIYEQTQIPNMQGFLAWMGQSDVEIKREGEDADNDAVRLMTAHHSKGLQAPVVFLPDTVSYHKPQHKQAFLTDNDLAYYPLCGDSYEDCCENILQKIKEAELEEYRRLLYVALTRAEDTLIVCGYSNSNDIDENSWYSLCYNGFKDFGVAEENIGLVYETPDILPKKQDKNNSSAEEQADFENWMFVETENENGLGKPYTPSKLVDEDDVDSASPLKDDAVYYRRGTLIHKLLQFLPQHANDYQALIDEYLHRNAGDFSANKQEEIKHEVLNLINSVHFDWLFGEHSQAEVPIIGRVGDKIISAQIDRLITLPDEHRVIIVDFKTNREAAADLEHTPPAYKTQLMLYAELIKQIYPEWSVESYILWTNETRLMKVA